MSGRKEIVELLLSKGAEVNATDKKGNTPLNLAAGAAKKDIAESLLANKADVNAKDIRGRMPLKVATEKDHKDVIELLHQHGGHE